MAVTQTDIDAVLAAIATGERAVTFSDGRKVEYRDVSQLRDALALLRSELAAQQGSSCDRDILTSFARD